MDNNYRGVTPLKKRRNKITLNAAIVLCIVVFILGLLCGKASTSSKQNQEAAKRIQEIEQEYEIDLTQLEKLNSDYVAELNKVKGELAQAQSKIAAIEKANEEAQAQAAAQEAEAQAAETEEEQPEDVEEPKPKESGGWLKKIILICLVAVIVLCVLLGASILLKKNNDDDEYDEEDEEFDDDIEYIEEDYNDDENE